MSSDRKSRRSILQNIGSTSAAGIAASGVVSAEQPENNQSNVVQRRRELENRDVRQVRGIFQRNATELLNELRKRDLVDENIVSEIRFESEFEDVTRMDASFGEEDMLLPPFMTAPSRK